MKSSAPLHGGVVPMLNSHHSRVGDVESPQFEGNSQVGLMVVHVPHSARLAQLANYARVCSV